MKQLRLWLLGLFALCGIAAVAQEATESLTVLPSVSVTVKSGAVCPTFTI